MARLDDYCGRARRYAERVAAGEILACSWLKLACERELADRERKDWEWWFDKTRANHICEFMEELPHVKGHWKSKTLVLEDWQCLVLCTVFGWVNKHGIRRFRKALVVIPRKNGKSVLAAGVGLYLLALDGEMGAEIYSAATTRDQAKISWGEYAHKMVQRMPDFRSELGVEPMAHSITVDRTGSFFKPLSRDADSLEGLNVHGAIIDELHAHKTREVFDVLDEATGSRRQPLLFIISTEGDSSEGVFPEQVEYAQRILAGQHEDERYFGIIYTIEPEDDWTDERTWAKANPNLGVSVFMEDMRSRCKQALATPDSQASFLTKRLNVRVGASEGYFNMLAWGTICKDESLREEQFSGQPCVIVIDLASKRDLTSSIKVFTRGGLRYVFGRHYLPSDSIAPEAVNYDFYRGWEAGGWLTVTEGATTDYETVEKHLVEDFRMYRPQRIGADPNYNALQLQQRMKSQYGIDLIDVPHTPQNFAEAMKTLDADIVAGRIKHNGDPVLTYAVGNVIAKKFVDGKVYPTKARAANKIDPAVALIGNYSQQLRLVTGPAWDFRVEAV